MRNRGAALALASGRLATAHLQKTPIAVHLKTNGQVLYSCEGACIPTEAELNVAPPYSFAAASQTLHLTVSQVDVDRFHPAGNYSKPRVMPSMCVPTLIMCVARERRTRQVVAVIIDSLVGWCLLSKIGPNTLSKRIDGRLFAVV